MQDAITSRIGRKENTKFLEQYRYIIVASQLLSNHQYHGSTYASPMATARDGKGDGALVSLVSPMGAAATASFAFGVTYIIKWSASAPDVQVLIMRMAIVTGLLAAVMVVGQAYLKRRFLHYLRQQNIIETTKFVEHSQNIDAAMRAALSLIQEVELVSRGYRMYALPFSPLPQTITNTFFRSLPLPPVTRLDTRTQTRRCLLIRRCLLRTIKSILPRTQEAYRALQPLADPSSLDKYYDVYDISDADMQEALLGYSESEFEDIESLRVLKILTSRFVTLRKMLLCCLLALGADGGKEDFSRWRTALEQTKMLSEVTAEGEQQMRSVLEQEECASTSPYPFCLTQD